MTSAEVAARAGVSRAAVSRVFTPGASASRKTVEKVRRAAGKLCYRPKVLARAMVSGRSHIIGLVVAYVENHFYLVERDRLSRALRELGYRILIFTIPNSTDGVDAVMRDLMDYQVEGIVAASVSLGSGQAARAQAAGVPVVPFNRGQDLPSCSAVTSASFAGDGRATAFPIAGGHQRIAHIGGWQGSSTGQDRQAGFLDAMDAAGLAAVAVVDGMYSRGTAMTCEHELLSPVHSPEAIFVASDQMVFGVIDVLRAAGLTPGRYISVVGYDDVPLAAWGACGLTTQRQPLNRTIAATMDTLPSQIEDPACAPRRIEIDGPLIVRGSVRMPEGWTR